MDVTSTNPVSNKDIYQYSESTLTAVSKLKGFETQVLLNEIPEASISLAFLNNMCIPFILPILVIIDLYINNKIYTNNILRNIRYTIVYGCSRGT